MAWRDSRSNYKKLALFMASIVLGIAAVVSIQSFSENLKENIETIDNALEKLGGLDGKTYNFIDGDVSGGVIAQDLEKVLPQAVGEQDGFKTVDYSAIIALLVNAVKELSAKVNKE